MSQDLIEYLYSIIAEDPGDDCRHDRTDEQILVAGIAIGRAELARELIELWEESK